MNTKEFAVIGLGRFGSNLALTLESLGHHVLGIDNDQEIVQAHMDGLAQALTLDSTNIDALRMAGLADFGTVIVAIGADFESNLLTTVSLKEMGAARVISRAQSERQARILERIGTDRVVRPEYDAGTRLAQELDLPGLLDRIALGPGYQVAEIKTPKSVTNQTLKQSNIRGKYGVTLLVVKRGDDILMSPGADMVLYPDDLLSRPWRRWPGQQILRTPVKRSGRYGRRLRKLLAANQVQHHKHLPAAVRIMLGLLLFILIGTVILLLPGIAATGRLPFPDAFFTAVSALTVTGLSTIDASTDLSTVGQIVLLLFIQIGGVGYMFVAVIVMRLIGRQVFILDRLALASSLGLATPAAILQILRHVLWGIFAVEGTGAFLLFIHWRLNDIVPADRAFFYAIFHAISAFCNAGFDLFSGSPLFSQGMPTDTTTLLILAVIIIMGGLGIPVLSELISRRAGRHRFSLHTQLTLLIVAILLAVGWVGHFIPEIGANGVLAELPLSRQLTVSFFQSVSNRTAGFAGLPNFGDITPASQLLTIVLMFIGSAPASMGGGITTGTFIVIMLTLRSFVRGDEVTTVWQRTISRLTVRRAGAVLTTSLLVTLLATFLILLTHDVPLSLALFEVISAFATCGLSLGLTSELNLFGQLIIIVMMIWGRLGALTIVVALSQREKAAALLRYPEETILIG